MNKILNIKLENNITRKILFNESMKKHTTFGIGGNVNAFIYPSNKNELKFLLIEAAKRGEAEDVNWLIEDFNAKIDTVDSNQYSALLNALHFSHEETALLLIEKGADISGRVNNFPSSPLQMAASKGFFKVVKLLTEKGAEADFQVINLAVDSGNEELLLFLLDKGNQNYDHSNIYLLSIQKGYLKVIEFLIQKGVGVNTVLVSDNDISMAKNESATPYRTGMMPGMLIGMGMPMGMPMGMMQDGINENSSELMTGFPTSLDLAIASDCRSEILHLLRKHGAKTSEEIKPLIDATINANSQALEKVFEELKGANNLNVNVQFTFEKQKINSTILVWAILNRTPDVVKIFLDNGVKINSIRNRNPFEYNTIGESMFGATFVNPASPLMDATINTDSLSPLFDLFALALHQKDNPDMVQLLIDQNIDINVKGGNGETPLDLAISKKRIKSAKQIRLQGGKTGSIYSAAQVGDIDSIKGLLDAGADVNKKSSNGEFILHIAVGEGHEEIVRLIIANGGDVNAQGMSKMTPLLIAVGRGRVEILRLLIENGADVNVKSAEGMAPLSSASNRGHREIVEHLIANGADVNANDGMGRTPLHGVALRGREEIAKLLIAGGADVNVKNDDDQTPLDLAIQFKEPETINLLRKHGAKTTEELKATGE